MLVARGRIELPTHGFSIYGELVPNQDGYASNILQISKQDTSLACAVPWVHPEL